jgi:hypothetical protein
MRAILGTFRKQPPFLNIENKVRRRVKINTDISKKQEASK